MTDHPFLTPDQAAFVAGIEHKTARRAAHTLGIDLMARRRTPGDGEQPRTPREAALLELFLAACGVELQPWQRQMLDGILLQSHGKPHDQADRPAPEKSHGKSHGPRLAHRKALYLRRN